MVTQALIPAPMFVPRGAESWRDPFEMYRELRDHDPLHYVQDGDYWVLSRFDDVMAAVRDTARFSSAEGLTFTYGEREKIGLAVAPLVMLDPPDHTTLRRLVSKAFTPRAVKAIEIKVRAFIDERLDQLADSGARGNDIVATLFKPLPSLVVAHYLGVPESDRDRFDRWTEGIVGANAAGSLLDAAEVLGELVQYFASLIERRRSERGEDVISALLDTEDEVDVMAIIGFAFTMVAGGNDTTTGLLGGASELMTAYPDQRRRLAADPSLISNAIEEFLRLTSPVQGLARTVTEDVRFHGLTIPAGRKVMLLYGSANRDEREFGDSAAECDVSRDIDTIVSFGYGVHHCLGAAAARLQAQAALEALLARYPDFEVDASAGRFAEGHFVRRYESLPWRP